jgi:hypothetical protein
LTKGYELKVTVFRIDLATGQRRLATKYEIDKYLASKMQGKIVQFPIGPFRIEYTTPDGVCFELLGDNREV